MAADVVATTHYTVKKLSSNIRRDRVVQLGMIDDIHIPGA